MFEPGCVFVSPCHTPHGVVAASIERHLAQAPEQADKPHRYSDSALWFQFETALPLTLTPWASAAAHRHADWHARWGVYRSRFTPDNPRGE